MNEKPTRSEVPNEPLAELGDQLLTLLQQTPDGGEVKAIVMLTRGERSVVCLSGWEDDYEAAAYMFVHLQAIFKVNGRQLALVPLGTG